MRKNLNRRKISILSIRSLFYTLFIGLIIISLAFFYTNKNFFFKNFSIGIESFSKKFQYQYINLNIDGLVRVKHDFIESKLQKYFKTSIFLLPLDKISNEIKENNWIKNVKLTTNYRDTLIVNLDEHKPIGLYSFNKKLFYFDINGKIIDEYDEKTNYDKSLIIFFGPSSNLKAKVIIDVLDSLNFQNKYSIKRINYIQKRRWDVFLDNNIKLMLSETNPKISLQNFIKVKKNLSETDMNNIKYLDLRNINKTLINYN